jgi:uncharacterized protein YigA (DUF484 family)
MHRLTLALLGSAAEAPARVVETIDYHLREDFAIPHSGFRAFGVTAEFADMDAGAQMSDTLKRLACAAVDGFHLPYCGPIHGLKVGDSAIGEEVGAWFGEAQPHLKSVALMAVASGAASGGVLALASEDEHRFYPGMGTLYLERLAESLSAALSRLFPAP